MLSRYTHQSLYPDHPLPAAYLMPLAICLLPVNANGVYSSGHKYNLNTTLREPAFFSYFYTLLNITFINHEN
jgi:hypothetical protein